MAERSMRERVLEFGPGGRIVGILTEPRVAKPSRPAVAIPNAGIVHRVGPHRLHVRIARSLADLGFPVLRLDLPGLGDSRGLPAPRSPAEDNLAALSAALDRLEQEGVAESFVALGLCSGADDAIRLACTDPRVAAAAIIDPPVLFPTRKHRILNALSVLAHPEGWRRLLTGRFGLSRRVRERALGPEPAALRRRKELEKAHAIATAALGFLIESDRRLLLVVTGHQRHRYSYRTQFFDAFTDLPLRRIARVVRLPRADHTFGSEADRHQLLRTLIDWLDTLTTAPPAAPSALDLAEPVPVASKASLT